MTALKAVPGFSGKLNSEEKKRLKEILSPILPDDAGIIVRTNSRNASEEELQSELERLMKCLHQVKEKALTRTCFSLIHENLPEYLQVLQNGGSVSDLSLAAPSLSAAKAMCRQWPKKYEEIYAKIMEGLL